MKGAAAVMRTLAKASTYTSLGQIVEHKQSPEIGTEYKVEVNFTEQREAVEFQMAIEKVLR